MGRSTRSRRATKRSAEGPGRCGEIRARTRRSRLRRRSFRVFSFNEGFLWGSWQSRRRGRSPGRVRQTFAVCTPRWVATGTRADPWGAFGRRIDAPEPSRWPRSRSRRRLAADMRCRGIAASLRRRPIATKPGTTWRWRTRRGKPLGGRRARYRHP